MVQICKCHLCSVHTHTHTQLCKLQICLCNLQPALVNRVQSDLCWVVLVCFWIFEWQWFASGQCEDNSLALLSTTKVKKPLVSNAAFTCCPISWVGKSGLRLRCVHVRHVRLRGATWMPKRGFIALYHSTIYSDIHLTEHKFLPSVTVEFLFLFFGHKGKLQKLHRTTTMIQEIPPAVQLNLSTLQ